MQRCKQNFPRSTTITTTTTSPGPESSSLSNPYPYSCPTRRATFPPPQRRLHPSPRLRIPDRSSTRTETPRSLPASFVLLPSTVPPPCRSALSAGISVWAGILPIQLIFPRESIGRISTSSTYEQVPSLHCSILRSARAPLPPRPRRSCRRRRRRGSNPNPQTPPLPLLLRRCSRPPRRELSREDSAPRTSRASPPLRTATPRAFRMHTPRPPMRSTPFARRDIACW
mmetsp:Transcript_57092/g.121187  ORF Transcript_57092/g.121187 Transcript_57092/m.121187 type:complete len:227 (+) Transcript_57092:22-702(+)